MIPMIRSRVRCNSRGGCAFMFGLISFYLCHLFARSRSNAIESKSNSTQCMTQLWDKLNFNTAPLICCTSALLITHYDSIKNYLNCFESAWPFLFVLYFCLICIPKTDNLMNWYRFVFEINRLVIQKSFLSSKFFSQ